MSNETIFSIVSAVALLGWLALILLPKPWRFRVPFVLNVPLLCLAYALLLGPGLGGMDFRDFNSLGGIMKLQGSEAAALVGWIHYLAFDLLVGFWMARDAQRLGLNRWLIVPSLLLTFMLGPIGWLSYLLIRRFTRTLTGELD